MTEQAVLEERQGERLGRSVRLSLVRDIGQILTGSEAIVISRLEKVPTRELNELRRALGPIRARLLTVRNSLCRLALRNLGRSDLEVFLQGTCTVSAMSGDVAAACKLLVQFSRDHDGCSLQGGWAGGQVLGAQEIRALAALPARPVLLAQLAAAAQMPIRSLAFLFQSPVRSLALALSAVVRKREKGD